MADALYAYASEAPGLTHCLRVVVGIPVSLATLALVSVLVAVALLLHRHWPTLAA
jgi:hypothetical protein